MLVARPTAAMHQAECAPVQVEPGVLHLMPEQPLVQAASTVLILRWHKWRSVYAPLEITRLQAGPTN